MLMHVDMDTFFVSCERLLDPELEGKPVIVGGRPDQRGVVAACSYEARVFGIHSAMPLRTAARLCPQAIFMHRKADYGEYSRKVFDIIERYTPLVEKVSVDEAYLDVSGCERIFGSPPEMAAAMQTEIRERLGLPCSIGISLSRTVCKIASKHAKPAGVRFIEPGTEADFLAPLPISDIPGIGKVSSKHLRGRGFTRIVQLQALDEIALGTLVGKRRASSLYDRVRGADRRGVNSERGDPKSVGHERTFLEDVSDAAVLRRELTRLAEKLATRLQRKQMYCRTLTLKLRDNNFETHDFARTMPAVTNQSARIVEHALTMFEAKYKPGRPLRLIGLRATKLTRSGEQLDLFAADGRQDRVDDAVGALRERFGFDSVMRADSMRKADE